MLLILRQTFAGITMQMVLLLRIVKSSKNQLMSDVLPCLKR